MRIQNSKTKLSFMKAKVKKGTESSSPSKIQNRGVSLYLAVMIMSGLLALVLGISAILFGQAKTIKEMGNSAFSFYAAESGAERSLFELSRGGEIGQNYTGSFASGASYSADIIAPGESCPALNFCVKSVGSYKNTRRAIQIAQ